MNPSVLEAELLAHLDAQLASGRKLLGLILEQGAAVRARDVDGVLARLADIQTEMGRRGMLESARSGLLQRAGATIGLAPSQVTLEHLCQVISPGAAALATERSAELRGLLAEIAREHGINRALMRQELAFLAHLTRLIGHEPEPGYRPPGTAAGASARSSAPAPRHVVNYQA